MHPAHNRKVHKFHHLALGPAVELEMRRVRATLAAMKEHKYGAIFEWSGVVAGHEVIPMFYFYVRPKFAGEVVKVYATDHEAKGLAKYFGLKTEDLRGSFFVLGNHSSVSHDNIHVSPIWRELAPPAWKRGFLKWIAREAKKLAADTLSGWETLPGGVLVFPGLVSVGRIIVEDEKQILRGGLSFRKVNEEPRAFYEYDKRMVSAFSLAFDKRTGMDKVDPLSPTHKSAININSLFISLLGDRPETTSCDFTIRVKHQYPLYFGPIQGVPFFAYMANGGLKEGQFVYLVVERVVEREAGRDIHLLTLKCYRKEDKQKLLCEGKMALINGYPVVDRWRLVAPDLNKNQ